MLEQIDIGRSQALETIPQIIGKCIILQAGKQNCIIRLCLDDES